MLFALLKSMLPMVLPMVLPVVLLMLLEGLRRVLSMKVSKSSGPSAMNLCTHMRHTRLSPAEGDPNAPGEQAVAVHSAYDMLGCARAEICTGVEPPYDLPTPRPQELTMCGCV